MQLTPLIRPIPRNLRVATLLAIALAASCGNDDGVPPGGSNGTDGGTACTPIPATYTAIHEQIFGTATCNPDQICHGSPPNADSALSFKPDKMASYQASTSSVALREGRQAMYRVRVRPGNLEESFLWVKIADPMPPGDRMPQVGRLLNQCELDAVRDWILAGAKND